MTDVHETLNVKKQNKSFGWMSHLTSYTAAHGVEKSRRRSSALDEAEVSKIHTTTGTISLALLSELKSCIYPLRT